MGRRQRPEVARAVHAAHCERLSVAAEGRVRPSRVRFARQPETEMENDMPDIDKLIAFENGELDEQDAIAFIQDGMDPGWVWRLQGFYGRTAQRLIDAGLCNPAK